MVFPKGRNFFVHYSKNRKGSCSTSKTTQFHLAEAFITCSPLLEGGAPGCVDSAWMDAQVSMVARSACAQLKLGYQLHLFLKRSDLAMMTHALVTSWLDYSIRGLPLESVWKL